MLDVHGLTGCAPHVLLAADRGIPAEMFQKSRGRTSAEWSETEDTLSQRGLFVMAGSLSAKGTRLRQTIETTTDELAAEAYDAIGLAGTEQLIEALDSPARAISASRSSHGPNPIGLASL